MRGKWLLLAAGVVVLGVLAGLVSLLRQEAAMRSTSEKADIVPAEEPAEVSLTGRVQSQEVVDVAAPIEGTIEVLLAGVGEEVFEGQLLARIKNTGLESSLDASKAELERAQAKVSNLESVLIAARLEASRAGADASRSRGEFERAQKAAQRQQMLYREGATARLVYEKTQKEFESVRAEYQVLQQLAAQAEERVRAVLKDLDAARRAQEEAAQEHELAEADMLASQVYSPVNGVLVTARGKAGDDVNREMQDLFQIAVDLSRLEVVVEPDPPTLARIRAGQPAEIHLAEIPGEAIPGTVEQVKEGQVFVKFSNPNPVIRPGLSAQVKIKLT